MKRLLIALIGVAILAVGAALVLHGSGSAVADLDLSRARTSAKGLYRVSIEADGGGPRIGELHALTLTLRTAQGGPVDAAVISVDGGMPDHNHGLPTAPRVTTGLGDGRYRVEGVKFTMSGWWVLKFHIEAGPGADDVAFNLVM